VGTPASEDSNQRITETAHCFRKVFSVVKSQPYEEYRMKDFLTRFGPWAVVTGASSGIGEAFARQLAARGIHLVLVARREERLQRLAVELGKAHGIETRIVPVDLASDDFLPVVAEATHDLDIGLLVNNAGVLLAGQFLDHELNDELNQSNLNNRAVLVLAHHFGRRLRERKRGGMIFLASTVAYAGVPAMSAYAASKAHALHFAEGFSREVRSDGIAVLALCPGPTSTEIWPSGATPSLPMRPEAVAEIALRKLGKRTTVVAGFLNRLITFSTRLTPRWMNSMIFGFVVGGMFKHVSHVSDSSPSGAVMASTTDSTK
jgi:uncharacterized protein